MNRFAIAALVGVGIIGAVVAGGYLASEFAGVKPAIMVAAPQELRKRCAKQTERVFTASGGKLNGDPVNGPIESYTDHYNTRLGKCFILSKITTIDTVDKETRKHYELGDAFEQATYAEYFESTLPGFIPLVAICRLTVPNEKPVICHSYEEWNRLVKPYIESEALTQ